LRFALAALLLAGCAPKPPAELSGIVRFTGEVPPGRRISMGAEEDCEKLHSSPVVEQTVSVSEGGALANAVVYIKRGLEGKKFPPPEQAVVLDQKGCLFTPRVIALQTGQTFAVRNSDPVSHNIHPMPKNNRDWNQQQPPGAPDLRRRFGFAEVVIPVKCNVHAWMRAYIAVVDHPFFAVTPAGGRFAWTQVPPGEYELAVWHETLGEKTRKVTLAPGAREAITIAFP
jgi:plastocyanin